MLIWVISRVPTGVIVEQTAFNVVSSPSVDSFRHQILFQRSVCCQHFSGSWLLMRLSKKSGLLDWLIDSSLLLWLWTPVALLLLYTMLLCRWAQKTRRDCACWTALGSGDRTTPTVDSSTSASARYVHPSIPPRRVIYIALHGSWRHIRSSIFSFLMPRVYSYTLPVRLSLRCTVVCQCEMAFSFILPRRYRVVQKVRNMYSVNRIKLRRSRPVRFFSSV